MQPIQGSELQVINSLTPARINQNPILKPWRSPIVHHCAYVRNAPTEEERARRIEQLRGMTTCLEACVRTTPIAPRASAQNPLSLEYRAPDSHSHSHNAFETPQQRRDKETQPRKIESLDSDALSSAESDDDNDNEMIMEEPVSLRTSRDRSARRRLDFSPLEVDDETITDNSEKSPVASPKGDKEADVDAQDMAVDVSQEPLLPVATNKTEESDDDDAQEELSVQGDSDTEAADVDQTSDVETETAATDETDEEDTRTTRRYNLRSRSPSNEESSSTKSSRKKKLIPRDIDQNTFVYTAKRVVRIVSAKIREITGMVLRSNRFVKHDVSLESKYYYFPPAHRLRSHTR